MMDPETAVETLTSAGCIVKPEAVDRLDDRHVEKIRQISPTPLVVNETLLDNLDDGVVGVETSVTVETEIDPDVEKRDVEDFVSLYTDRYESIRDLLLRRREIENAMSISRVETVSEREDVSLVGLVIDKYRSSSGKFIVTLEDPTGRMKTLVPEEDGERIVQDEMIGVTGAKGDGIVFANSVVWPDIPLPSSISTTNDEVHAAFISDIHFGSMDTLTDKTAAFVDWLNKGEGVAGTVRYLFIAGDVVEGVGVYPDQEDELTLTDVDAQYERFEEFVCSIRDDIEIIICPGNHDPVRLAEPQPPLPEDGVPRLYERDNVHLVPNPAYVNIHTHDNGGVKVLMYHGTSFDGHVDALPHLREDAYENPDRAMIDWLKRRHLAPIYGSTLQVPRDTDPLVIDPVPDIMVSGHTHSFACTTYKGVNVICAGTFQGQTDFQKRHGHVPDPGKVAIINLQTREPEVKAF